MMPALVRPKTHRTWCCCCGRQAGPSSSLRTCPPPRRCMHTARAPCIRSCSVRWCSWTAQGSGEGVDVSKESPTDSRLLQRGLSDPAAAPRPPNAPAYSMSPSSIPSASVSSRGGARAGGRPTPAEVGAKDLLLLLQHSPTASGWRSCWPLFPAPASSRGPRSSGHPSAPPQPPGRPPTPQATGLPALFLVFGSHSQVCNSFELCLDVSVLRSRHHERLMRSVGYASRLVYKQAMGNNTRGGRMADRLLAALDGGARIVAAGARRARRVLVQPDKLLARPQRHVRLCYNLKDLPDQKVDALV